MADVLERLKVLIDSSTPIVVMETVEEMRATRMVRAACAALNLAAFEWTIASGLARCGTEGATVSVESGMLPPGGYNREAQEAAQHSKAIYNSQEPAQMLANLAGISIDA